MHGIPWKKTKFTRFQVLEKKIFKKSTFTENDIPEKYSQKILLKGIQAIQQHSFKKLGLQAMTLLYSSV